MFFGIQWLNKLQGDVIFLRLQREVLEKRLFWLFSTV